jgi:hypothetical protein
MPQGARIHTSNHYPVERQAFHRPHSSLGTAAHYVKEVGILAPLIISECVKDPGEKWRYIKLASLVTALMSQGMWTARIHTERKHAREREPRQHSHA